MKKSFVCILLLICGIPGLASGYELYFNPAAQTVAEGEVFGVDLWVSGFGDGVSPTLAAFDIDIIYEETKLGFQSVTFQSHLGVPDTDPVFGVTTSAESDIAVDSSNAGLLSVKEISFLPDSILKSNQPAAFSLATLQFEMLQPVSSVIGFQGVVLSESLGGTLYANLQPANVYAVPVPPALILLASALIGLGGVRRFGRRLNDI